MRGFRVILSKVHYTRREFLKMQKRSEYIDHEIRKKHVNICSTFKDFKHTFVELHKIRINLH